MLKPFLLVLAVCVTGDAVANGGRMRMRLAHEAMVAAHQIGAMEWGMSWKKVSPA
jgi:hypothetical protein